MSYCDMTITVMVMVKRCTFSLSLLHHRPHTFTASFKTTLTFSYMCRSMHPGKSSESVQCAITAPRLHMQAFSIAHCTDSEDLPAPPGIIQD